MGARKQLPLPLKTWGGKRKGAGRPPTGAKPALRVIHYSVQGNHLHLLVEADGAQSLARGVQGLCVRLARALNRVARRHGGVFAERYHAHVLASRREVARALRYLLENFRHHLREDVAPRGEDPCSSAAWLTLPLTDDAPVLRPRTWLLRHARDG